MQRVVSVKSVLQEKKEVDDDDSRSPECVERVWMEGRDGAWAEGKAPVHLLTALLSHVQDDDVAQAELTARAKAELESESESESEEDDDDDDDDDESDSDESEDGHHDDNDEEEASPQDCEEKNNEEK